MSSEEGRYRINYLFELLEKQDKGHEIIIAAGADAEKKRILDIIKDESSLKSDPRFIKIG